MSFDFSSFSTANRHIAHRAGRGDGDAERDATWIQAIIDSLGGASGVGVYPIELYTNGTTPTPGTLDDTNVATAIQNAYTAALANTQGGIVQIPAGIWHVTTGLDLYGSGDYNKGVVIQGAGNGATILRYPGPWTGEMIRLRGSSPATGPFRNGGLKDLIFAVETVDAGSTGKGVVLDACTNTFFENIHVYNLQSGTSWYCRDFSLAGGNSQNCTFINVGGHGGNINFDFDSLSVSQFYGAYAQSGATNEWLLNGCQLLAVYGGSIQTDCPVFVRFAGTGGCNVSFEDIYWEGVAGNTFFKMELPTVAQNYLSVNRLTFNSPIGTVFDVAGAPGPSTWNHLNVNAGIDFGLATTVVKARYADVTITANGAPNDPNFTSKFDLDTATYNNSQFLGKGYFMVGGNDYSVTALNDVVAPYAYDIWDPGVTTSLSLTGASVNSITGVVNGNVMAPPFGKPTYAATDAAFNNQATITCAQTGVPATEAYLLTTLSTSYPVGANPAMIFVFKTDGSTAARRQMMTIVNTTNTQSLFIVGDDGNVANNTLAFWSNNGGSSSSAGSTSIHNTTGHICIVYVDSDNGNRGTSVVDGNLYLGNVANAAAILPMQKVFIGGDPSTSKGQQMTFCWAAALRAKPPAKVLDRITNLIKTRFGL